MEDEVSRNKRLGVGWEERGEEEKKRGKQFLFLLYSIQRIQHSLSHFEDGNSIFLQNVGTYLPDYMVSPHVMTATLLFQKIMP
jgi:hypothetical protein